MWSWSPPLLCSHTKLTSSLGCVSPDHSSVSLNLIMSDGTFSPCYAVGMHGLHHPHGSDGPFWLVCLHACDPCLDLPPGHQQIPQLGLEVITSDNHPQPRNPSTGPPISWPTSSNFEKPGPISNHILKRYIWPHTGTHTPAPDNQPTHPPLCYLPYY